MVVPIFAQNFVVTHSCGLPPYRLSHYMRAYTCAYECLYTNYKSFMQSCQHQNKFFFIFPLYSMPKLPIYLHQMYDFDTHLRFCRFLIFAYLCTFMQHYSLFLDFMRYLTPIIHFILHRAPLCVAYAHSHARLRAAERFFNKSATFIKKSDIAALP